MKQIKIESCMKCPHNDIIYIVNDWEYKCTKVLTENKRFKPIGKIDTIPDWCPLEDADTCKWTKRFEEYSNCLIGYTTGCFAEDCDEHSNYSLLTDYCPECGGKIEVVE